MEFTESSVVKAVDHQTATEVDGENVILDLEEGIYYGLNPVGARIWEQIQEPARVGDVVTSIADEYDVSHDQCFEDVAALLRDLEKENLITVKQR
jgi:hypothetical protein